MYEVSTCRKFLIMMRRFLTNQNHFSNFAYAWSRVQLLMPVTFCRTDKPNHVIHQRRQFKGRASCLIARSDGAARVRCSGCSFVRDSGGVLSVQLLLSAFVLCLSCCLDLFNMQLLLHTPARAPIRCQARVVEQCLRALHLNPESYQLLSLCASGWA